MQKNLRVAEAQPNIALGVCGCPVDLFPVQGTARLQKAPEAELYEAALSPAAYPGHRSLSLSLSEGAGCSPKSLYQSRSSEKCTHSRSWFESDTVESREPQICRMGRHCFFLPEPWKLYLSVCGRGSVVPGVLSTRPSEQCLDWCLTRAGRHGPARLTHVQLITVDSGLHPFLSTCPVPPWLLPLHVLCAPGADGLPRTLGPMWGQGGYLGVHAAHV